MYLNVGCSKVVALCDRLCSKGGNMQKSAKILPFPQMKFETKSRPPFVTWDMSNVEILDDFRFEREFEKDALHMLGFGNRVEFIA